MENANIGLSDESKKTTAEVLNKVLSDEYVLYTKTRNFHWNVTGIHFNDLHKFFEEQYEELNESIDEIAERVRMLGLYPKASMKEFLETSSLNEVTDVKNSEEMLKELLADHESIISEIREKVDIVGDAGDAGNEDFIISLMQKHEKIAWMLRSMNK